MTDCCNFKGAKNHKGYGQIRIGRKLYQAHRVVWEKYNGDIPKGLFVLHRCDNPSCINPDHLFLGTNQDNIRDSVAKGRWNKAGEKNGRSKLKESDIRIIRASNDKQDILAHRFKVAQQTISRIKNNVTWKTLK